MYNQYLDNSQFIPVEPEPHAPPPPPAPAQPGRAPGPAKASSKPTDHLLGEVIGGVSQLLEGVLKHFSLKHFDTGDILLVLIILFLFLEGDNLEIAITLGLMLLLGLDED